MKHILFIIMLLLPFMVRAQSDIKIQQSMEDAKARLVDFNTEHKFDSIDQEQLPRIVSGGLFAGCNMSNFIITRDHHTMSSYMRVGAELGGFLNFNVAKHFVVQPQVIFTAHQNHFEATDTTNHLWSFGAEIPIYFLGRYGSLEQGYILFGGGLFTHFTFASNVKDKYSNLDESPATAGATSSTSQLLAEDKYDYSRLYSLHNNHFGVCVMVGYECYFGMFINATYKVSFSDIAGFYKEMKGTKVADALIYPQSVSLQIGYRWR
ncbi:MAG: outer membrane beta-barrel protein [Paludibacteraceae bacterium]|nr:outer membrane beta-barrel protein [Paludibacteraceae bacterium]